MLKIGLFVTLIHKFLSDKIFNYSVSELWFTMWIKFKLRSHEKEEQFCHMTENSRKMFQYNIYLLMKVKYSFLFRFFSIFPSKNDWFQLCWQDSKYFTTGIVMTSSIVMNVSYAWWKMGWDGVCNFNPVMWQVEVPR